MSENHLLVSFVVTLPLLLVSLVIHELAHGWMAWALGDPTAKAQGRLSPNPIRHLDLWGSIALVVTFIGSGGTFFFGWARPVPVNPRFFKDPQRGMMLVGAAGPVSNYLLALVSAGLVWLTYTWNLFIAQALVLAFLLNVLLGTLNLLPIPPLDGSRVVGGLMSRDTYRWWSGLDRYGTYVFIGFFAVMFAFPQLFESTVGAVVQWSFRLLPGTG